MKTVELHPTADALIEAGLRLAEAGTLAGISVNAIVGRAGVAKGTFYVHFPDRSAYLVALHRRFHDQLARAIASMTAGLDPGPERLRRATAAYLNGCLGQRAVKALLLEARSEPAIVAEVRRSNKRFAGAAAQDFAAMGWPSPDAAARLFVALAAEVALAELDAGGRSDDARRTLWRFAGIGE